MELYELLRNISVLKKVASIIAAGVLAYVLRGVFGMRFFDGDMVVSVLTCLFFAPVFDLKRPLKFVGIVCLIGFLIGLCSYTAGFGRGFVQGFKDSYYSPSQWQQQWQQSVKMPAAN